MVTYSQDAAVRAVGSNTPTQASLGDKSHREGSALQGPVCMKHGQAALSHSAERRHREPAGRTGPGLACQSSLLRFREFREPAANKAIIQILMV